MEEAIYRTNAFSSPSIDYSHVIICYPYRARLSLFISHSPHIHNTHASYIRMRWKYERCVWVTPKCIVHTGRLQK